MSWRYPPHLVKTSRVVEMEDLNEDFQVYVEEASGHLNEHNFASGIFSSNRDRLAEDISVRLYRTVQESDPNPAPIGGASVPVNSYLLSRQIDNWHPISDMSITLESPGSSVFITFSAQFNGGTPTNSAMFGLEMNGSLLPNSVIGGLDLQNDSQSFGVNTGYQTNSNLIGLYGKRLSICLETTQQLLPGSYTFRPVYYIPVRVASALDLYVTNRELFIIETVR